jgi:capsular polysaccharide biosynthesis protein
MIGIPWNVEDAESRSTPPGVTPGAYVSLHYLRSALRRRWRLVATTTMAGVLLAVASLMHAPTTVTAEATVLLAHDSSTDPSTAIATDTSLLTTRTVARKVIEQLDLPMTPDEFLGTFSHTQVSTQVLDLELTAPTSGEAVRRLAALSQAFLSFRNEQLRAQAQAVVTTDQSRIVDLRSQIDQLNGQYNAALAEGRSSEASELLGQRVQIASQISTLQQTMQDALLQADSLATASHVVDQAAVVPEAPLKGDVLTVMSGLIGGLALGVGLVFATALVSNRLRRREEVATALGSQVRFSAGAVHGRVPWGRSRRRRNLDVLAAGLVSAVPVERDERAQLALLGAGDPRAAATVLKRAAHDLQDRGENVLMVDLTSTGWLDRDGLDGALKVYRPGGRRPELTAGPLSLVASMPPQTPHLNPRHQQWNQADVVLVLGEVELGVGTSYLNEWADRAVVLVGAGRVSAEFVRSTGRLLARSGPSLEFAMLVGADSTDESMGDPIPETHHREQREAR